MLRVLGYLFCRFLTIFFGALNIDETKACNELGCGQSPSWVLALKNQGITSVRNNTPWVRNCNRKTFCNH